MTDKEMPVIITTTAIVHTIAGTIRTKNTAALIETTDITVKI
jgi:hypothetical protein